VNFHDIKVFKTYPGTVLPPGVNFINMFTCSFFAKDKKLLVFENEFHHTFLSQICGGCDIRKSHLAVLVAICKSQLVVLKKASKKPRVKFLMKSAPSDRKLQLLYLNSDIKQVSSRLVLGH
jgi:hypothetical protein